MEATGEREAEGIIKSTGAPAGSEAVGMGQQDQATGNRIRKRQIRAMVAVDDSQESSYALKWTLDKLLNFSDNIDIPSAGTTLPGETTTDPSHRLLGESSSNNRVTLVHVMEPLPHYAYPRGGYVVESATKTQEHNADKILSRAFQLCMEKKVAAEKLVLEGDPKQKICEAADNMRVDVLVVGSRGLGQIKRALLGSVSDYCAHHARCPVLIVKLPKESHH
ncbi:OLC1v1033962C2 [Oldenlandia corymbosa var. corymbosa]|uniref:OLC1v1033962C2 n=1 Tax=Oldenlandia corymbosa var. corymbosa TaxID=529605 RepID=A0AAV1CR40_OLDCO|nr:OLC1v1033962C2 [Oldenlandia corymbosa var. corymbosa]